MSRLIRMDHTGHTTLVEWTADDSTAIERAIAAFEAERSKSSGAPGSLISIPAWNRIRSS